MRSELVSLKYEVEIEPGEKLVLPEALIAHLGPGRLTYFISVSCVMVGYTPRRDSIVINGMEM